MYFTQSLMIQQFLFIHHMLLMIFMHSFIHLALIISCDFAQRMNVSMIFFSAFNSCFIYSLMHWHFTFGSDSDFDICSLRVLMNFSSFIVFQLQHDLYADSLQTLRSIIVCTDKWFKKFFIFLLISHFINLFMISSVVKIKSIIVWNSW